MSTAATTGGSTPKDADDAPPVHLAATGLDNMLEALELVNAKSDKSSVGAKVCPGFHGEWSGLTHALSRLV